VDFQNHQNKTAVVTNGYVRSFIFNYLPGLLLNMG
jgi:hypothetical protein